MYGHSSKAESWQKCSAVVQAAPAEDIAAAGNVPHSHSSQHDWPHLCVCPLVQVSFIPCLNVHTQLRLSAKCSFNICLPASIQKECMVDVLFQTSAYRGEEYNNLLACLRKTVSLGTILNPRNLPQDVLPSNRVWRNCAAREHSGRKVAEAVAGE